MHQTALAHPLATQAALTLGVPLQILVSLSAELATTLLRNALVPTLHQPPTNSAQDSADAGCPGDDPSARPPALWFPEALAQFCPALTPLLVHALAPSIADSHALTLDLLVYPATHEILTTVLPGFHTLHTLHLALSHSTDHISDSSFERMIYSVCTLPALRTLSVSRLGRRGVCVCALADMLPHAQQLTSLTLEDVPLKRVAGGELVESLRRLPALARLELRDCAVDDGTLTRLRRTLREMRGMRELTLRNMKLPPRLAVQLVADCARLPALNVLTLDESLTEFFAAPRGVSGGGSVSDSPSRSNSGSSGGSTESGSSSEGVALAERLATALGNAAALCELRITQSAAGVAPPPLPPGAATPAQPLQSCAAHMPLLFGEALSRHLSRCVALTSLHLSHVIRGNSLGDILSTVPQLRSLTVVGVPFSDIAAEGVALGLRQVRKLHHLDLSHCKISDSGMLLLSASLRSCSRLRVLRLCRCGSSASAASALADCLPKLPLLQELNMDGWGMGPEGMREVAPALAGIRGLRVLNFAWNRISSDGVRALVHNLTSPQLLQSLNLKFNCISNGGMHVLAGVLRRARSLSALELDGNMFGADGMATLCAVMLGEPEPEPAPVSAAAAALGPSMQRPLPPTRGGAGPAELRVLGLSGCAVGVDGVRALAAAAPKLPALRVLDFPDLLLMFKLHRADLFQAMAAMRSANPLLCVRT